MDHHFRGISCSQQAKGFTKCCILILIIFALFICQAYENECSYTELSVLGEQYLKDQGRIKYFFMGEWGLISSPKFCEKWACLIYFVDDKSEDVSVENVISAVYDKV
jgi:hypothetical protein